MSDPRALILALPQPVILVGQDERVRGINDPALRLIGSACDGWHYISALRQPAILDAVEATLGDGGQRTARYLGNDGARDTTWDVAVRSAVLSDGRVVVLTFTDMTALEQAGQMRRDFVANVSHELRTPLTSLLGFIETLRGPARNDAKAQDRFLEIMEQEAGRMHRLVEDLLSLSRVEDQERVRPTTRVNLNTLVAEVVEALRPVAQEQGVQVKTDCPPDPVEVLGDWGQLWQVLRNLVENAIKYGVRQDGTGGTVTISVKPAAHEPSLRQAGAQLRVRDEGAGIAAYHIARLTERFYRVDSHRSREVGGTGLGLAIVKHIINRHRGRLRIESTFGEGTEFTVILPLDLPDA